ncbi:MAG: synthase family protein, partial [Chitinophagaceae bacterium]|nr:synthase family protein [Chitinophagaceae bacterium]
SDHGYRCFPAGTVSHAFVNLFSVYLPDKNYIQFNDSITNVNVFRALFNTAFDEQFPMLESKSFTVGK